MVRPSLVLSLVISAAVGILGCSSAQIASTSSEEEPPTTSKHRSIDEMLLFFPSRYPEGNWTPDGLRFQDVWFTAEDQTRLHAWYCPCDNPRAIVLMAHGNAGNVADRAPWLKQLQTGMRIAAFLFDYRGYGRSEGVPTVPGVLQDARAARAKLRELTGIKDSDMLIMGESLGGAVAVQLAAESAPRGLILQSTFSSMRDVANFHYPKLAWLVPATKLDSATQIARYRGPLLQSHGDADRTIPFTLGEKLFRAANEPKTFFRIAKADHNDWLTPQYLVQLNRFIETVPPAGN